MPQRRRDHREEKVKTILILGGSGNTGEKIARLLLDYSDVQITLAARNENKLRQLAEKLGQLERVSWKTVDASDKSALVQSFTGVDMVVFAASTALFTENIASACIEAKCDYLDIQYSNSKVKILKSMVEKIKASGQCFISEAGFHPGLPAALVRYANSQLDVLESAITYSAISMDMNNVELTDATKQEFIRELQGYDAAFFHDGQWKKANMWTTRDFKKIDFGEPAGKKWCIPMMFEEIRNLPEVIPTLKETSFYITGFGWIMDWIITPFSMIMVKLFPKVMEKPMGNLFTWAWKKTSKPPFYTIMKLKANGIKNKNKTQLEITLFHEDGYWFTAIPVVACLLQYLDGIIQKPGLHWMGQLVDPTRLLDDLKKLGIKIG